MILGDPGLAAAAAPLGQSGITLDGLFRRAAARRPGAIALADAPNRTQFADGAPLRLSYAEADRMISAIAGRLRRMGLPTDSIVGIQMPNIVENVLTILGVLRAGLIAAPLP
ncbi:MAG: AMP-binding protein, partial [Xanthobacteraceae bacterium]